MSITFTQVNKQDNGERGKYREGVAKQKGRIIGYQVRERIKAKSAGWFGIISFYSKWSVIDSMMAFEGTSADELCRGPSHSLDTWLQLSSLEMGSRKTRQWQGWNKLIKRPDWVTGQAGISFSWSLKARLLFPYLTLEDIQMYLLFKGVNCFLERIGLRRGIKYNSFTATNSFIANHLMIFFNQQPKERLQDRAHTVQKDYGN